MFQRLFDTDTDKVSKDDEDTDINTSLAHNFCRYMLVNASFLKYKPSKIAATSLILHKRINQLKDENLTNERLVDEESLAAVKDIWNPAIQELTGLDYEIDLK